MCGICDKQIVDKGEKDGLSWILKNKFDCIGNKRRQDIVTR